MIAARKVTFQLASLLDLLLIVMFAQYLEMRSVMADRAAATSAQQTELKAQLDELAAEKLRLAESLRQAETQVTEAGQIKAERDLLAGEIQSNQEQAEVAGKLLRRLFDVPSTVLDPLLRQRMTDGAVSFEQIAAVRRVMENLADTRGTAIVDHLLTYHELEKRCDLWDLFIDDTGLILLDAVGQHYEFRAESSDEFQSKLYDVFRTMPQPKSLVLVLMSYGDTRFQHRLAVQQGLPVVLERLQSVTSGRSRFEFAVLGLRLGPALRSGIPLTTTPTTIPTETNQTD